MKIISLFSGCGGLDLGFKKAGFNIVWANDFDKDAVKTYQKNLGMEIVLGDITKISSSNIPDNPDVVLGGFPCQGFSVANNKRSMDDKRNFLYKELLRVVKDKKPKVVLGENVKGILSMNKGKVIDMIISDFKDIGYKLKVYKIDASEYDVPQKRERVLFIAVKNNNEFTLNLKKSSKIKTVKDTIFDLYNLPISYNPIIDNDRIIYNHIASTNVHDKFWGRKYKVDQYDICDYLKKWRKKAGISTKKIDDIFGYRHTAGHWFRKDNNSGSIPKPSDWWKLKGILEFDDTYDKHVTELEEKEIKFEQSLRITNWDTPSDTITATSPEIHINKQRRLSVRECARLQTFPDDFIFKGSLNSMYRQIGNAVPPVLSFKLATQIKDFIKNVN